MEPRCDACRRRRVACIRNSGETACSLCTHRQTTCTFLAPPPSRKPKGSASSSRTRNAPRHYQKSSSERSSSTAAPLQSSATKYKPSGSTIDPTRTFLYAGSSGNQMLPSLDPLLNLWQESDCLGNSQLVVWKVGQLATPSYLAVVPNGRLDCHSNMYSSELEELCWPYHEELIRLYYKYVHPSYPILGSHTFFETKRRAGHLPSSLVAVVYMHGAAFWNVSPLAAQHLEPPFPQNLRQQVYSSLTSECRTPNLAVLQAALLFMQLPAPKNEPSFSGIWGFITMTVGMAQDIALHVDPTDWNISAEECSQRRIVWWAVFVHDIWMSHWLGRPPHISQDYWNVRPLTIEDISFGLDNLDNTKLSSAKSFIALCELTVILRDVLHSFYSIRSGYHAMLPSDATNRADVIFKRLEQWSQSDCVPLKTCFPHEYVNHLGACTVCLSVCRAVYGAARKEPNSEAQKLMTDRILDTIRSDFLPMLSSIRKTLPQGLWLIYTKGSLAMVGSLLVAMLGSSIDDVSLRDRHGLLLEFRDTLRDIETRSAGEMGSNDFVQLPLKGLDFVIEQCLQDDV